MNGPIRILTALESEAAAVRAALPRRSDALVDIIGIRAVRIGTVSKPRGLVILAGLGGGLDPSLVTGDVVIDDTRSGSPQPNQYVCGKILTTELVASTPREKALLYRQSGAVCVDMEQSIVRAWAAPWPVVGVRAICDTANDNADPRFLSIIDDVGRPRLPSLASLIVRAPGVVPSLIRLGRQSRIALRALGAAVARLVGNEHPRAR